MVRVISDEAYSELEAAVGADNVSRHPAVLDSYAFQPFENHGPEMPWCPRPLAVVLPATTEEVSEIIKACNRHGIQHKAFSTGWGMWCGPSTDNCVQVDLRRMDRIIEIDEKNQFAVVEPYVNGAQLQAEAFKLGLNTHIIGAGPNTSPLASATSMYGVGHDGIYMGYSGRTVLGVEWVSPTGEIFRFGTLGSGKGWSCGDGPGISLRGIMRGYSGAMGGNGIYTRVALKLFNWSGPSVVKSSGTVVDLKSEVPENIGTYMCFFPNREKIADAYYDIGEAEIGYNLLQGATPAYVMILTPHLFKHLAKTKHLKSVLQDTMGAMFVPVLVGTSKEDFELQERTLKAIVDEHDGFILDLRDIPPVLEMFVMNLIRATMPALVFRIGGSFSTALGRNDSVPTQLTWANNIANIKRGYAAKGQIIDDMGDSPYLVPYENNMYAHCECVYPYDHRNQDHLKGSHSITMDFIISAIDECMEPGFGTIPFARKILSPLISNYNKWQKKVSEAFDPDQGSDKAFFTDEADFDFSTISPDRVRKLEALIKQRTWTELGPQD